MKKTTFGVYENTKDVDNTLTELAARGYTEDDVSIIAKKDITDKIAVENDATEGITQGAKTGGLIGGILGLLTGIGALTLPGIGALFITGPLVAAFGITGIVGTTTTGALTGALAGGLVTGLKELGIDERIANTYEDEVKAGNTLLCVYTKGDEVEETMENNNAKEVNTMELKIT